MLYSSMRADLNYIFLLCVAFYYDLTIFMYAFDYEMFLERCSNVFKIKNISST
jgi:hypothetical protein